MTGVEKVDRYARQRAEAAAAQTADFDSWRAARARKTGPSIRIAGRVFTLPKQAPLMFTIERHRLQGELSEADVRRMVGLLFGEDALTHLAEAGLDHDDLGVLLLWGGANVGSDRERVTLDQAQAEYEEMLARGGVGKATRATRRANARRKRGGRSSATGR